MRNYNINCTGHNLFGEGDDLVFELEVYLELIHGGIVLFGGYGSYFKTPGKGRMHLHFRQSRNVYTVERSGRHDSLNPGAADLVDVSFYECTRINEIDTHLSPVLDNCFR